MDNQAIPKQKNMARGIMLRGLKLYHPAIVNCFHKKRLVDHGAW